MVRNDCGQISRADAPGLRCICRYFRAVRTLSFSACIALLWLASCKGAGHSGKPAKTCAALQTGAVIATDSVPSHTDPLNNFTFRAKLSKADGAGQYAVLATVGPNEAPGQLTMPRGGEDFCPEMHRATGGEEAFIIGFRTGREDDTAFYPYYRVAAHQRGMEMNYIKAYTFQ